MPADPRRAVGASGEDAVCDWYRARGFEIVARNWRIREGELDVVARRGATLVFCEVKTRRGSTFGTPAEAVTARKQRKVRMLARAWLARHRPRAGEVRFDVAAVTPGSRGWTVDVIEGAF